MFQYTDKATERNPVSMTGWFCLLLLCSWACTTVLGGGMDLKQGLLPDTDDNKGIRLLQEISLEQSQDTSVNSGSVLVWGDLTDIGPTPPEVLTGRVVKISAGGIVAMALLDTKEVVAWAASNHNAAGQADVPKEIQGQVVDISAGEGHCLALLQDGSVTAWGNDQYNQTDVPAELRSGGRAKATAIAAGTGHSLALLANGSVVAWGRPVSPVDSLVHVPALAQANVIGIATSTAVALAVLKDGSLVQWGWLDSVPAEQGVQAVSAGLDQVVALLRNGSVVAWGRGAATWPGLAHHKILSEVINVPPAARSHVVAVSAAENITLALRDTGEVVAWGHDAPDNTVISSLPPETNSGVIAIASGNRFAMAVVPGTITAPPPPAPPPPRPTYPPAPPPYQPANQGVVGSVLTWGDLQFVGQTPSNVTSGHVMKIAAGYTVALALLDTHEVVAWSANNSRGQADVPPAIQGQVVDISAGASFAVALLKNGSVVAWGSNRFNQTNVPADLQPGGTVRAVSIAAGYSHALAILANGSVMAWGRNDVGQTDVPAAARHNVISVSASASTTLAVLSDGSTVSWGDPADSDITQQYGVQSAAIGTNQVVAVLRNGTVITYPYDHPLSPDILGAVLAVPPAASSHVVAVAASENTSMALRDTGEVVAWGWAATGIPVSPVPPAVQSNVIAIATGSLYCMALIASSVDGEGAASRQAIPPDASDGNKDGATLGTGAVAGIVVGAVALLAVIATSVLLLLKRMKSQSHAGKGMSPDYSQVLKGTAAWDALTKFLRPEERFMRSVAPEYSWIISSSLGGVMHTVEAGVNDTQLDKMQQNSKAMASVVELNRSELQDQVHLLADGLLGRGGTALVFKCVWPSRFGPNSLLAIKVLKDGSDADMGAIQSFAYEAKLLASLQHPNVVRVYGYCLEPPTVCLILELLPTSLKQRLYGLPSAQIDSHCTQSHGLDSIKQPSEGLHSSSCTGTSVQPNSHPGTSASGMNSYNTVHIENPVNAIPPFPTPTTTESDALVTVNTHPAVVIPMTMLEIVRTSTDIAAGLAYLHSQEEPVIPESEEAGMIMQTSSIKDKRIVHRDLKPANILLNSEGAAKITDFGLARDHDHTTVGAVNMGAGTVPYMAPEQLTAARAGRAGVSATNRVDVYSLGMMMWEMLAGEMPWQGKNADMVFALVMNHRRPPLPGASDQDGEHVSVKGQLRHMPGVHDHPLLPQFTSIIQACWHQRDRQRPTAAEVHGMLTQLLKRLDA